MAGQDSPGLAWPRLALLCLALPSVEYIARKLTAYLLPLSLSLFRPKIHIHARPHVHLYRHPGFYRDTESQKRQRIYWPPRPFSAPVIVATREQTIAAMTKFARKRSHG